MTSTPGGGADSTSWADPLRYDDVMLPLELKDLARTRPRDGADAAYLASWLLRKAALFDRVAGAESTGGEYWDSADNEFTSAVTKVARNARRTGLKLQRQLIFNLVDELLTDKIPTDKILADNGTPTVGFHTALENLGSGGPDSTARRVRDLFGNANAEPRAESSTGDQRGEGGER